MLFLMGDAPAINGSEVVANAVGGSHYQLFLTDEKRRAMKQIASSRILPKGFFING